VQHRIASFFVSIFLTTLPLGPLSSIAATPASGDMCTPPGVTVNTDCRG